MLENHRKLSILCLNGTLPYRAERITEDLNKEKEYSEKEREILNTQIEELTKLQDKKDIELIQLRDKTHGLTEKCQNLNENVEELNKKYEDYVKQVCWQSFYWKVNKLKLSILRFEHLY